MTQSVPTHCRHATDADGVAWLTLDLQGQHSNTLSSSLLGALEATLDTLLRDGEPAALVLRSAKDAGFLIGPDAEELESLLDPAHAGDFVRRGQALTARIAALSGPTVSLLHGRCRGVGLELALACRYRIAMPNAVLCFPDVHLDLHPCIGGTARLADLIGATPALNLLETGREVDAESALSMGLVDVVHSGEEPDEAAIGLIRRDPGAHRPRGLQRVLSSRPAWWLIDRVREADDVGDLAPECRVGVNALRALWRQHGGARQLRRIRAERSSILRLLRQPQPRNRIRIYTRTERYLAACRRTEAPPPERVHVIGAGDLGARIAQALASRGCRVTLGDQRPGLARSVCDAFHSSMAGSAARENGDSLLQATESEEGPEEAECVIEAIDEDAEAKRELLAAVEPRLRGDAVLASTTSTLSLERLAAVLQRPERLVGMHFPRQMSGSDLGALVELGIPDPAVDEYRKRAAALIVRMERLPLPVREIPGRLIYRLLMPYILCGAGMYSRAERELIDGGGRYLGMAMGPLELADWIGLDVCLTIAEAMAPSRDLEIPGQLRDLVSAGSLGQRTGHGFHDWRGEKRVTASPAQGRGRLREVGDALLAPTLRQAQTCRDEGIAAEDDLIDVAAVLAAGFPACAGGPLAWARDGGVDTC